MNKELSTKPVKEKDWLVQILHICGIAAGIALLITVLLFSIWRWHLTQNLNTKTAAIRAAGLPLNWDDLAKWPVTVPDDENAAFIYTNALAHLKNEPIQDLENVLLFHEAVSGQMLARFESFVGTNLSAIQIINKVTNASKSRYPINYSDGPMAQLPHLSGLKEIAVVLACDAILNADASNATAASEDIQSSLKLSHSLDNEPILISQLTSAGILTVCCHGLEGVLCRTTLSEGQLSRLELEFNEAEAYNRFLTGLIGDRALNNEFIRLAQDDVRKMVEISNEGSLPEDQSDLPSRNPGAGWRLIGFWERDRNYYLDGMATNIFFMQQGPPASLLMSEKDEQIGEEARYKFYICSAMFLPTVSGVARRDASTRAYLRDAVTALAVERWRLTHHGALPDSLDDLVPTFLPAVPADPFDGKPLRYKKSEKGYRIYSIGPNLRDDGGKEIPPPSAKVSARERLNYDIVFIVER